MIETNDPLLKGKELSVSEPVLTLEIPETFILIPNNVFQVVIAYLRLTWSLKSDGSKKIPLDNIIENTIYLFSKEGKYKDKLWKEHTATNLRELFCDLSFPKDYCRAVKNINRDEMDPEDGLIGRIIIIGNFLSLIVHYRWSNSVKQAQKLYSDKSITEKNLDEAYEKVCIDLFYTFYELYKKYAFDDASL